MITEARRSSTTHSLASALEAGRSCDATGRGGRLVLPVAPSGALDPEVLC